MRLVIVIALLAAPALASAQAGPSGVREHSRWRPWTASGSRIDLRPDLSGLPRDPPRTDWLAYYTPPEGAINPAEHHRPRAGLMLGGTLTLTVGWLGAIAIGAGYLAQGGGSCDATSAWLHFAPVGGALTALVYQGLCSLWSLGDILASVGQIAGAIMLIVGASVGERGVHPEGPRDARIRFTPSGGLGSIGVGLAIEH